MFQIKAVGLPLPETEVKLKDSPKKWRYDMGWRSHRLLVEIQGGTGEIVNGKRIRGKHVSPDGYHEDRFKSNFAQLSGFRCLEVTGKMIKNGQAIQFLEKALAG